MTSEGATTYPPPDEPRDGTTLEDVVLDSSRSLMSAHPDEFGTKIEWTLGSVAGEFGADRCGTFLVDPASGGASLVLRREWTGDGVDPRPPEASTLDPAAHPWLFERLEGFRNAVVDSPAGVPDEAAATRAWLAEDGVESAVFLPLVSDWELLGAVTFETFDARYGNAEREVGLLRTFADMLGHALARTRRERELRRKNDRLEEFASVVSHDLRNPLNVVQASIEFARREPLPVHFDRGAEAAGRMERLIEQVLSLARVGQDIGETGPVDPAVMARKAWESIHAGDATLETSDVDPVVADRDRLLEAFENLFRNSVEHSSTGSRLNADDSVEHRSTGRRTSFDDAIDHGGADLTVRVGPLPGEPGFYVADDGDGILKSERDRVLERGYTSADGGTGLGLSIVSRIVDAHGWAIDVVESEAGGARFEFRVDADRGLGR